MCEIGNKIRRRREELGLSLEDVAKAVGVGRSTVQRWETGLIKNMGRDKIAALAKVLQMNPVELVPMPGGHRTEDDDILEALHQDQQLRMLFHRYQKMPDADKEKMINISKVISGELYGE